METAVFSAVHQKLEFTYETAGKEKMVFSLASVSEFPDSLQLAPE